MSGTDPLLGANLTGATGPAAAADALSQAAAERARAATGRAPTAEGAAKDFESVLIYRMLMEMKRTIPKGGLLNSPATDQMQDMFWLHLADELSRQGGLGLWKQLHRQFVGELPGADTEGNTP
jgi:Rod binding domain-containing protein